MAPAMKSFRFFLPLFFSFVLLFAQQAGVAHTVHHAFEDLTQHQDGKQAPNSSSCEKCADYAQLGSALSVGGYDFIPLIVSDEAVLAPTFSFHSLHVLAAAARGPPSFLQTLA